ncbi:MAG: hypothetical protein LBK82_17695 [Planctomycetaceae bacterium]|nr:hypothetical protein [Planctomycetaceae bacterium]
MSFTRLQNRRQYKLLSFLVHSRLTPTRPFSKRSPIYERLPKPNFDHLQNTK